MKNKRSNEIIRILLENDRFITIKEIGDILSVSNKTIRNDLEEIERRLESEELKLIKKPGIGITIEGKEDVKMHLRNSLRIQPERFSFGKEDRLDYLAEKLLYLQEFRIYEAAEELFVSRATIHKDLNNLETILSKNKLKMIRQHNRGVTLTGSEKNIRKALDEILLESKGFKIFCEYVENPSKETDGTTVFYGLDLNDDEIKEFIKVLEDARSPYLHVLNLEDLSQIVLMILVIFLRVQKGKVISLSEPFIEELEGRPFFDEARYLLDALRTYYRTEFNEIEARYLQVFFLSLHNGSFDEKESEQIAKEMISFFSDHLNVNLNKDEILYRSIRSYLNSAITRLKHGIGIENPLMNDVHAIYPKTLQIVDASSYILKNHLSCEVPEEEKGLLALYLAAALERSKKPLRTALISSAGDGATQLLEAKIARNFPEIDMVRTYNYVNSKNVDQSEYDLILCTQKTKEEGKIVVINPVLYPADITRLKKFIREFDKKKNDPKKQ